MSSDDGLTVELRYFESCPNWKGTRSLIEEIVGTAPRLRKVETLDAAEKLGFTGSPTVLIDGIDPWAHQASAVSMSCRIYRTPEGKLAGGPTEQMLREALLPKA